MFRFSQNNAGNTVLNVAFMIAYVAGLAYVADLVGENTHSIGVGAVVLLVGLFAGLSAITGCAG